MVKKCTDGVAIMNFYYEKDRSSYYINANEPLEYPAHFHKNIELIYINNGTARAIANGDEYNLTAGDFFIAFPEVVHSYDNCNNISSTVIIVSASHFPEYSSIFENKYPLSPVIRNAPPETEVLLSYLVANKNKYDSPTIRGFLLSILGTLLSQMQFVKSGNSSHVSLQEILHYCKQNYQTDISIEKLSKDLRISKSYISHTFSNKVKMSFRTYINLLRLYEAVNLLENTSKNITEIASEAGFESIRTFNRAFKTQYGISPTLYRRK